MKKILNTTSIFMVIIIAISIFSYHKVNATVGGEILISNLKYNPADQSIYYIESNLGGRGCPPELNKLSLESGKTEVVYSCLQAMKIIAEKANSKDFSYNSFLENSIADLKTLNQINLSDYNISITRDFLKAETLSPEGFIIKRYFKAHIYQNSKEVDQLEISSCDLDSDFKFKGYIIPGFNKKIILISNAKGDCFEGGYLSQKIYLVSNVDVKDKAIITPNVEKGKK